MYTHPNFVADPSYCPLDYTYVETTFKNKNGADTNAITRVDQKFTVSYSDDLSPVTPTKQVQVVTITAKSKSKYLTT